MKKHFVSLFVFLLMGFSSVAQDSVATMVSRNRYFNLDFGVGYMHTDLGNINGFLSSYGYRPIQENIATLSVAPSFFVNRFVFRGEYTWQVPVVRSQPENIESTFSGHHVAASIGYVILQKPGYRLYPFVGINSFTSRLEVREKGSASGVDDLVNHQERGFNLVYSNASLDVGFQVDKLIPLRNSRWDCPQNARYITIGIRAGYIFSPGMVKGRFNGDIVEGAPAYAPGGPYIKLVIGLSTKARDLKWKK